MDNILIIKRSIALFCWIKSAIKVYCYFIGQSETWKKYNITYDQFCLNILLIRCYKVFYNRFIIYRDALTPYFLVNFIRTNANYDYEVSWFKYVNKITVKQKVYVLYSVHTIESRMEQTDGYSMYIRNLMFWQRSCNVSLYNIYVLFGYFQRQPLLET